jgi:hypothetical protein
MPHFPTDAARRGAQAAALTHIQSAREFYAPIIPFVVKLRQEGLSLRAIARDLQARGIPSRVWNQWSASQVRRVLQRAGLLQR